MRPDFVLLVVLGSGLLGKGHDGFHAGLLGGFLVAPLTADPFGLDAALLGACGLLAGGLRNYVRAENGAVRTTTAALFSFAFAVLALGRIELAAPTTRTLPLLIPAILAAAATGLAAPAVLAVMEALRIPCRRAEGRPVLV